jgi:putative transcriptional regulator
MPRIENRFTELLERKRRRDKAKKWTYREIADETGISPATLTRYAQQRHNQFDNDTLAKLCEFLDCTVGDLLVLVDEDAEPGQVVAVAAY